MILRLRGYLTGSGLGPDLIKAVLGSAGVRVAGMLFGFLVGVQLARALGVEGYGIYGLAMSILALLTVASELGLPQLLTREVARADVERDWPVLRGLLRWSTQTVVQTSVSMCALVSVALLVAGRGAGASLEMALFAGLPLIPLVAFSNLRGATLRALQQIVKGQLPDTLIRPMIFSLTLFLASQLAIPMDPSIAMGLGVAAAAIALLVVSVLLHKDLPAAVRTAPVRARLRVWWRSTLPMALTEGMRVLHGHLAVLLLGLIATTAMVGLYRVAASVVLLVAFPVSLLNVVSAPILARLYAQGDAVRLQRLLSWIAFAMVAGTSLLALPFFVGGRALLTMLFGEAFGEAHVALSILCIGMIANAFFGASAALLNMTHNQGRVMRATALSVVTLLITAPPAIGFAGLNGAAAATALSMIVWEFLMWRDARRLLSLDTSPTRLIKLPGRSSAA